MRWWWLVVLAACGRSGSGLPDARLIDGGDGLVDAAPGAVDTLLATPMPAVSNVTPVTMEFSATTAATFTCWVNDGEGAPCTSPVQLAVTEGAWSFEVRATSAAGVEDPTPARTTWTVDLTAPTVTLTQVPAALDNSTSVSIEFSLDEPGQAMCALAPGAPAPCTSPWAITVADGPQSIEVHAVDVAGNVGAPDAHAWTVDTSTPDTVIDAGPSGLVRSTTAQFQFSSPNAGVGATYACSLDGAPATACTSPVDLAGLAEGPHTFEVTVSDVALNPDPTPATRSWTVDTVAPNLEITAGPLPPLATPTFTFAVGADATVVECQLDGAFAPCTSPFTGGPLPDGAYVFTVRARDAAGNEISDDVSFNVAVELVCNDGADDDGDTFFDCNDSDCDGFIGCVPDCTPPGFMEQLNLGGLGIPTDGLVLFLRADANVATDSLGNACYWYDNSPASHHVWQDAAGLRPVPGTIAGQPALQFPGGLLERNDLLGIGAASARTIFIVAQHQPASGLGVHAGQGDDVLARYVRIGATLRSSLFDFYGCDVPGAQLESDVAIDGNHHVLAMTVTSLQPGAPVFDHTTCRLDGAPLTLTAPDAGPAPVFTSFASADRTIISGTGTLAEVLIYDRALSAGERDLVEAYLADRYDGVAMP